MEEQKKIQQYRFDKSEKLCSQNDIDQLFKDNESFIAYPLRVIYHKENNIAPSLNNICYPQILISVPKRNFKRANKRNRIKRLIREAYRLNKLKLIDFSLEKEYDLKIALVYLKKEMPTYVEIEMAMQKTIKMIINKIDD